MGQVTQSSSIQTQYEGPAGVFCPCCPCPDLCCWASPRLWLWSGCLWLWPSLHICCPCCHSGRAKGDRGGGSPVCLQGCQREGGARSSLSQWTRLCCALCINTEQVGGNRWQFVF